MYLRHRGYLLLVGLGGDAQGILQGGRAVLLAHIIKGLHHMLVPGTGAGAQLTRCGATASGAATVCTLLCTTIGHLFLLSAPEKSKTPREGQGDRIPP